MDDRSSNVQTFVGKTLHSLLFLEEFTFARNKFRPPASSEVELADAVVLLGDVLLIYQIKERMPTQAGDEAAERKWFQSKVLGKATKQVRDTLGYLRELQDIRVSNERGHVFNLAGKATPDTLKIVIYAAPRNLPEDCRAVRRHLSRTAGFIHILDARDYLELSRTVRVPEEVVRYFRYRETVFTRFADMCGSLPEAAIAGHFIGGDPDQAPTIQSVGHLRQLVQDDEEWDLAPLLRSLHQQVIGRGQDASGNRYYDILIEFAKLPRSMWREVKARFRVCVEKAQKDQLSRPYRIACPNTDCGFVFVPASSELTSRPDWRDVRLRALQNFVQGHKYDQRLSKCIGILVAKDGEYFDIQWCLIAYPWVEDAEIQRALDESSPFRPVKTKPIYGYRFVGD